MEKLGQRLQSRGSERRDVPLHALSWLGWSSLRLRLQPDAYVGLLPNLPQTVLNANLEDLAQRLIQVGQHCYGSTARAGSSRGGVTT